MRVGKCVCIVYECTCLAWLVSFPDSCAVQLKSLGTRVLNFLGRGRKSFCDRGSLPIRCRYWENLPVELFTRSKLSSISNRIFTFRSNRENVVGGALVGSRSATWPHA